MVSVAVLVAEYLADCRVGLSANTVSNYRWALDHLLRDLGRRGLRSLTAEWLRAWLVQLQGRYSLYSVHSHWRSVRAFMRWLVRRGKLRVNPLLEVRRPVLPDEARVGLSVDDARALVKAAGKSPEPVRDRALVVLMLDTGLRREEVAGVTVAGLDCRRRLLTVKRGKGGKGRLVPVSSRALRAVRAWLSVSGRQSNDSLFGLTRWGVRSVVARLGRLAGVKVSPHVLRHTFATLYAGDIEDLRLILGHSEVSTTAAVYRHRQAAALVAVHDKRSPLSVV